MSLLRIFFPYVWHYVTDDYKDRLHHLVIDTLLSFVILGLLGMNIVLGAWFYLFSIEPNVQVTVDVPAVVISGAPLTLQANVTPLNKAIADVKIKFVMPSGYAVSSTSAWTWPTVGQSKTVSGEATGIFNGTVGATYRVIVLYEYHYFGQYFHEYATAEFTVDTSSLEVVATAPEHILNQESFTWTVEYNNSSDLPRTDVCVQLDMPASFFVEASSLPISAGRVMLAELAPRQSGAISITGSFKNAIGEGANVIGVAGIDACSQKQYRQIALTTPIQVLTPRLQFAATGPTVVNVGDTARYTIRYTNAGDAELAAVNLTAALHNFSGRYRSIAVSGNGSLTGDTVRWTDTKLVPGETRSQTFTVATNPNLREKNVAMSYGVQGTAEIADLGVTTYAVPVPETTTQFNSTLHLTQVARYTSTTGEQLGYGPYPLQAWTVTALRVFWQVEDFTNDLTNATITATLPSQVEWTGHTAVTEGAAMTYDPVTRRVTWHSSSISSFSHAQGASFEVRILPNSDQVGKQIHITNEVTLTARDAFTGTVLTRTLDALVTDQPIQPEEK